MISRNPDKKHRVRVTLGLCSTFVSTRVGHVKLTPQRSAELSAEYHSLSDQELELIAEAVALLEYNKDQIQNTIPGSFLGPGSSLLEEASTTLSEREVELANETEKDKVVERCDQVCQFPKGG